MIPSENDKLIFQLGSIKANLIQDPLFFTETFYKLRTGRDFKLNDPPCRENHCVTIAKALQKVWRGESTKLMINIAPRHSKTEMLIHFIAWSLAINPESNFLYVSLSYDLAVKATSQIKDIIETPFYRKMFGVELRDDSAAKGNFQTKQGGTVVAVGSGGTLTGFGAGVMGADKFSGAIILDDLAKPEEIISANFRERLKDWFFSTLWSRRNDAERTPIIMISQRLHEDDLCAYLLASGEWDSVILKELDEAGNALCPHLISINELLKLKEHNPYVFASQYQQDPVSPGTGLFKAENFPILDNMPDILMTCIICDTASSVKEWADYTVFGFFGIYEIKHFNQPTGLYGIHFLDCYHERVEPKDLQNDFMSFYAKCCGFGKRPSFVAIEKKNTGETLVSVLNEVQGLNIIAIERNIKSGSKIDRFINSQSYISQKLVTFPYGARHVKTCIDELIKITAENSHRHDDIADVLADIIRMVCIDKTALAYLQQTSNNTQAQEIIKAQLNINRNMGGRW